MVQAPLGTPSSGIPETVPGFGEDFVWGVATSAYQIEGGATEDGRGESIWDRFTHNPVYAGATGDVACDHFHRWPEDIQLMADLGVSAYRFSIAWTRVLPNGDGPANAEGLAFYERLIDGLLAAGIEPWVTLYHWDLPQSLQDRGGWTDRDTVSAFAKYADVVSGAFGDRVNRWITHNEPWVAAFAGHLEGVHAPGWRDWGAALAAAHHLLLSHGRAVPLIHANAPNAAVGIALDCRPSSPTSDDPADLEAQRHFDGFRNRWFFDPIFGHGYPADMLAGYRARGRFEGRMPPFVHDGDLATIATPIDFLGLNYYTSVQIGQDNDESEDSGIPPSDSPPPGYTEMGWAITPRALTDFLVRVNDDYAPHVIYITENGASYSDAPDASGRVRDQRRIDYLYEHLGAVANARDAGVPVAGYFMWSLLDNLEWSLGFSQRFGLVYVDHETGDRIPKDSYRWYDRQVNTN